MRGFLLVCGLSAVACGFGACGGSAFSSGSGDDGGTADGSSSSGSSGGSSGSSSGSGGGDASSSSSGSGSGSGSSSGSSGGTDGGPPARWCDTQKTAFFCEDFDGQTDVTQFLGTWSTFQQNSGQFSFDRTGVPSAPNALRAAGINDAGLLVVKSFPHFATRPTSVRLEFALRINNAGNVGLLSGAGFAAIAYGPNVLQDGYVAMAIGNGPAITAAWGAPGDAGAGDAGTFQATNAQGAFPSTNQWAGRFAIEIDYEGGGSTASPCAQVYQGPTALLKDCMQLPPSLANPGALSIAVGDLAVGLGATGTVDLEFDNLTANVAY